jgi:hypothetical protein
MDEKDCGLIGVRLEHLANLPNWTAKEAALFSLGMAPTGALSKSLGAHYAGDSVRFFKNVKIHVDLFERHEDRLTPSEWVRWCDARRIDFHEDLKRLIVSPDPDPDPDPAPAPAPTQTPKEVTEQRQRERWELCELRGLKMPTDTYSHYPRGISKVAKELGIKRSSLTEDLNKYRERNFQK